MVIRDPYGDTTARRDSTATGGRSRSSLVGPRGDTPAPSTSSGGPRDPRLEEGERLFQSGRIADAARVWERAVAASPGNDHLLNRLGDAELRLGRLAEALRAWERAAESLARGGFFLKAVPILRKIQKAAPDRIDVQERIADYYARGRRDVEAQDELRALGDQLIRSGQIRRAIEVYERLAHLDGGDVNVQITLAHLLVEGGRISDASRCYTTIGRSLAAAGHVAEAIGIYRRAVEIEPDNPTLLRTVAGLLHSTGDLVGAISALERAVEATPSNAAVLVELRELYLAAERGEDAERILARVAAVDPGNLRILTLRAEELIERGEVEEAFRMLRELADRAAERGEGIRAVAILAPVLRVDPDHLGALKACLGYYRRAWAARLEEAHSTGERTPDPFELDRPELRPGSIRGESRTAGRPGGGTEAGEIEIEIEGDEIRIEGVGEPTV